MKKPEGLRVWFGFGWVTPDSEGGQLIGGKIQHKHRKVSGHQFVFFLAFTND
jgi:hypothetical protein